jgi:hypothetical protein
VRTRLRWPWPRSYRRRRRARHAPAPSEPPHTRWRHFGGGRAGSAPAGAAIRERAGGTARPRFPTSAQAHARAPRPDDAASEPPVGIRRDEGQRVRSRPLERLHDDGGRPGSEPPQPTLLPGADDPSHGRVVLDGRAGHARTRAAGRRIPRSAGRARPSGRRSAHTRAARSGAARRYMRRTPVRRAACRRGSVAVAADRATTSRP